MYKNTQVRDVLILTLALNAAVSLAKILGGYYFRSISMVADGFHSLFDASSNVLGLIGIRAASKPPDESHPYGHKKFETLATLGIAMLLFITCFEILKKVFSSLSGGQAPPEASAPSFAVMAATMAVNIFVAAYEARKGRELKSDFLTADSAHTRSDILASLSVVASLVAVRLGYPKADPVFGIIIAVLIARAGIGIIRSSSKTLCDATILNPGEVESLCMGVPGVVRCHHVRSRGREDAITIDLRVHVDPKLTAAEAHEIAHQVEDAIRNNISGIADVLVHIEPEEG